MKQADMADLEGFENQQSTEHGGGGFFRLGLVFGILIVGYVLSVGPVAKFTVAGQMGDPAVKAIYKPLAVLVDHFPPAARFFDWYVFDVWKVHPATRS